MNEVLQYLYESGVCFPDSSCEEAKLARDSEALDRLEEKLSAVQPELWQRYKKAANAIRNRELQTEFERGFLLAARLLLEVYVRDLEVN